ncbi:MAG: hypothetical protein VCD00_16045 [Candidatus Hydrogenedentota bacterium]
MPPSLRNCMQCDRVILSDDTRNLCDVFFDQFDMDIRLIENAIWLHKLTMSATIGKYTRLSIERVTQLLEGEGAYRRDDSSVDCANCKKKPALDNSKYCLACQLAVYKSLGDNAERAAQAPAKPDPFKTSPLTSLRNTLEEKRNRAGFNRFNPSTPSIKGTGGK